jgi:hypothetical protein
MVMSYIYWVNLYTPSIDVAILIIQGPQFFLLGKFSHQNSELCISLLRIFNFFEAKVNLLFNRYNCIDY